MTPHSMPEYFSFLSVVAIVDFAAYVPRLPHAQFDHLLLPVLRDASCQFHEISPCHVPLVGQAFLSFPFGQVFGYGDEFCHLALHTDIATSSCTELTSIVCCLS